MLNTTQISAATEENFETDNALYSDGIARVHGMSNVQAEELVEYVVLYPDFDNDTAD